MFVIQNCDVNVSHKIRTNSKDDNNDGAENVCIIIFESQEEKKSSAHKSIRYCCEKALMALSFCILVVSIHELIYIFLYMFASAVLWCIVWVSIWILFSFLLFLFAFILCKNLKCAGNNNSYFLNLKKAFFMKNVKSEWVEDVWVCFVLYIYFSYKTKFMRQT